MNLHAEIINQVESLRRLSPGVHRFSFHINGHEIPTIFRKSNSISSLIITFHGAIDRKVRQIPAFVPLISGLDAEVSQLSVSDPSMLRAGNFNMSWYAGHQDFRSQEILSLIFAEIAHTSELKKIVFFGGSGGGFAALYYSSLIANSIAVAAAPQTNILKYYAGHTTRYRECCWPGLTSNGQLSKEINLDLCVWYETPRPNRIIYLQSAGDHFHTRTQLAPFLDSLSKTNNSNFIINSGYWGKLGHSGSVTKEAYMPWLHACFDSQTNEVDDLLQTHRALSHVDSKLGDQYIGDSKKSTSFNIQLKMAELLRNYHIDQD